MTDSDGDSETEQVPTDSLSSQGDRISANKLKVNVIVNAFFTNFELHVSQNTTGRELFDQVSHMMNLKEVWFFGLLYKDTKGFESWLKLKKKIFIQDVGKKRPIHFKFRAKFYPEEVTCELNHQVGLRLFYEQVKEDILGSALYCTIDTAVLLASFAIQEKYGNYNTVLQPRGFLAKQNLLPKTLTSQFEFSDQQWEDKIVNFYKDHRDMTKEQAMMEYLRITQDLEMFGISYFEIKNKKGTELFIGVDPLGINVFEKEDKLKPKIGFPWDEIRSISFKEKKFTIFPVDDKSPNFIFVVSKSRINKKILALCMGNHELFIRRRKVSPSQRNSTVSRSSEIDSTESKMSKVTEEASSDYQHNDVEEEYADEDTRYTSQSAADVEAHVPTSSPALSSRISNDKEPSSHFQEDEIPKHIVAERVQSFRGSAVNEDNTHLYSTDFTPYGYEELPGGKLSQDAASPKSRRSILRRHSPNEVNNVPESCTALSNDEAPLFNVDVQTSENGQEEIVHYTAVLPKHLHSVYKEDSIPTRRKYLPSNKDTYQKLVELFEEFSANHAEGVPYYSRLLDKDAANKYQTLKHIRFGYAHDRIALFEAM